MNRREAIISLISSPLVAAEASKPVPIPPKLETVKLWQKHLKTFEQNEDFFAQFEFKNERENADDEGREFIVQTFLKG